MRGDIIICFRPFISQHIFLKDYFVYINKIIRKINKGAMSLALKPLDISLLFFFCNRCLAKRVDTSSNLVSDTGYGLVAIFNFVLALRDRQTIFYFNFTR